MWLQFLIKNQGEFFVLFLVGFIYLFVILHKLSGTSPSSSFSAHFFWSSDALVSPCISHELHDSAAMPGITTRQINNTLLPKVTACYKYALFAIPFIFPAVKFPLNHILQRQPGWLHASTTEKQWNDMFWPCREEDENREQEASRLQQKWESIFILWRPKRATSHGVMASPTAKL